VSTFNARVYVQRAGRPYVPNDVSNNADGNVFAYSSAWLNYEQYKAIETEAIRNISSTMAVMVVIIALLIVTPSAVAVVCLVLCLIIINIIGRAYPKP